MKKIVLALLLIVCVGFAKNHKIVKIPEASGICYCKDSKSLFVVSDRGIVYQITPHGKILREKKIGKYDFEGIACQNSDLLIAVEGSESVLVLDKKNFKIKKEVKINRKYQSKMVIKKDKEHGIEGITVINGKIYLSNQSYKKYPNKDASIVFQISTIEKKKAKIEKIIKHNLVDIAGLDYHNGFLYMVSDKKNLLIKYNLKQKKVIKKMKLPHFAMEGIAFDEVGNIYFADDEGEVLKYKASRFEK